jgi:hypothetical protein
MLLDPVPERLIGAVWEIVCEGGEAAREQVIWVCSGAARCRLVRPLAR